MSKKYNATIRYTQGYRKKKKVDCDVNQYIFT